MRVLKILKKENAFFIVSLQANITRTSQLYDWISLGAHSVKTDICICNVCPHPEFPTDPPFLPLPAVANYKHSTQIDIIGEEALYS